MSDLSTDLRDYFDALVASIDDQIPDVPAVGEEDPRRGRRWLLAGSGLVAAVALAIAMLVARDEDRPDRVHTADEPSTSTAVPSSFRDLEPGWHLLDTGPVPPMPEASIAWTGTDLLVVGLGTEGRYQAFAYAPADATWRELPPLPDGQWPREGAPALAWTGDELLVVERSAAGAAVWDPGANAWEEIDPPSLAGPLQAVGAGMRADGARGGPPALVWTGEAVLDLTHGSVWSPDDRTWGELALPENLIPYARLAWTTAVLVDGEVIAAPWSTSPGLAWNATGTSFREVPGMPADLADEGVVADALATSLDGRVYLVSGTEDGRTASLDPRSGTWRREPAVTRDLSSRGCPTELTTLDERLVVALPCGDLDPMVLGEAWEWLSPEDPCCDWPNAEWIDADGVLVSWSTSTDTANDPAAPYIRAAVWVPFDEATAD